MSHLSTVKHVWSDLLLLLPPAMVGLTLGLAGNPSDAVRLAFLSAAGIWLTTAMIRKKVQKWWIVMGIWWSVFLLDAVLRSISWLLFDSDVEAYLIISSVANTTQQELLEFVSLHFITFLTMLLLILTVVVSVLMLTQKYVQPVRFGQRGVIGKGVFSLLGLLTVAAYLIEPSRNLHPIAFWTQYHDKILAFQAGIHQHKHLHTQWDANAKQTTTENSPFDRQTHVLVLTDSVTSQNLSVCGYPRQTTPHLEQYLQQVSVFCHAYASAPATIPSLKLKLTNLPTAQSNDARTMSLLSGAKAHGYKIFWISNQSDSYISSLFGSYAHQTVYLNQKSGRSTQSLDEKVLPAYQQALQDAHAKKLIVVHLMGAHPNYHQRYPEQFARFEGQDRIEQLMDQQGYSEWVQVQRNHYDNAVLYQDWMFKQLFDRLIGTPKDAYRSFVFVSDHGNEVGHERNYIGHSPHTQAGYQVPLIVWHDHIKQTGVSAKMVKTAELDVYMMRMMGIQSRSSDDLKTWLDEGYQFPVSSDWPYWKKKGA